MLVHNFIEDSNLTLGPFKHQEDAFLLKNIIRRLAMKTTIGHYISHIYIEGASYPFQSLESLNVIPAQICQNLIGAKVKAANLQLGHYVKRLHFSGPREIFLHDFADDIISLYEVCEPICCLHSPNTSLEMALYIVNVDYTRTEDEQPPQAAFETGIKTSLAAESVAVAIACRRKKYYLDISLGKCLYPKEMLELVIDNLHSKILNPERYNFICNDVTEADNL